MKGARYEAPSRRLIMQSVWEWPVTCSLCMVRSIPSLIWQYILLISCCSSSSSSRAPQLVAWQRLYVEPISWTALDTPAELRRREAGLRASSVHGHCQTVGPTQRVRTIPKIVLCRPSHSALSVLRWTKSFCLIAVQLCNNGESHNTHVLLNMVIFRTWRCYN